MSIVLVNRGAWANNLSSLGSSYKMTIDEWHRSPEKIFKMKSEINHKGNISIPWEHVIVLNEGSKHLQSPKVKSFIMISWKLKEISLKWLQNWGTPGVIFSIYFNDYFPCLRPDLVCFFNLCIPIHIYGMHWSPQ